MDWLQRPEILFTLIVAISILAIGLLFAVLWFLCRNRLCPTTDKVGLDASSVELRSNVTFQYTKEIEKQQVPIEFQIPRRSYPGSPAEPSPTNPRRYSLDPRSLDLDMYHKEESKFVSPYTGLGRISFSVVYEIESERLKINLLSGYQLPARTGNVFPTPYVKVCILPDKKRKMQSRPQKGFHPDFNEVFIFSMAKEDLDSRILRFTICDFDRFSRQSVVGYVLMPLAERKEAVMSKGGSGVIWKEVLEDPTPPGRDKGSVLFSLSYLPTAGRLSVVCLKARDLNTSHDKDTGVAMKISLISSGRPIKTKKTTQRKVDVANPVFNESFVFDTPNDVLDRVSLVLAVYAYMGLGSGKRLIGRTTVGPYMYAVGEGLAHWNDMLASPRSAVAQWHKLS